ncbi:uncharacterized protein LOC123312284 [Coccinella septempunctata]|uniref:uncharacterized protein LOC123312284 n=1 Tax=Coccinella septempunctata TaxID=41139 RepID=UPI001D08F3C6|nr:uncharacterized protein LOC123312284 [Coccinella septempunctata]
MKIFVVVALLAHVAVSAKLPFRLEDFSCNREDPNLSSCVVNSIEKARPYVIEGIKELNIPPIDPFILPYASVNRTISELVSINSVLRNAKTLGLGNYVVDNVSVDLPNHAIEFRYTLPWAYLEMEYDVSGQLLQIPLQSKGFFKGNFTDTQMVVKATIESYQREGETYYRIHKMTVKGQVGDGWVKMTAKNPDLQFGADLIANAFNADPRAILDAVNPIFVEFAADLFKAVGNQVLARVPATKIFS